MKKSTKILSLTFSLLMAVSCAAGCNKGSFTDKETNTELYQKTGYKLVDKGLSEYVILLPETPSTNEYKAAEELNYFLGLATNATISVVKEGSYTPSGNSSIISIGDTAYADTKGIVTSGGLDRSGYVMKTVGNQLFIRSDGDDLGCVYAVYDLLESTVGYRYYYTDEIYYEEKESVELYAYDIVADPDFDFRAMSTWNAFLYSNEDYMRRTRTFRRDDGWAWGGEFHMQGRENGVLPHSEWGEAKAYGVTKGLVDEAGNPVLDEETGEQIFVADHWYSKTGEQLCWTAGEEMYYEAAQDIIQGIQSYPDKKYFSVGQADVLLFCDCARCETAKEEWALNDEGLQIHFINRVASYVNEWVAENCPERDIVMVIAAYYATQTPPVVKDEETGKWVPYSDKVVIEADNVAIHLAPINSDYSVSLEHIDNEDIYNDLVKWNDFLDGRSNEILLWTYDTNFHYFFYNFNNFDTFTEQAKSYKKFGVSYFHSQGANGTNQPCFQEMRYFVESQILWDTSRNYNDLVNEFMQHFYKDAWEEIREYYDLTRMRYEQAEVLLGKDFSTIYSDIGSKDIWTRGVVNQIDGIFQRAYAKIAHYKTEDISMYEKLLSRIKELELTNTYTKLNHYSGDYTQSELNLLVDEFNYYVLKFDVNEAREGGGRNGNPTLGMFDELKK